MGDMVTLVEAMVNGFDKRPTENHRWLQNIRFLRDNWHQTCLSEMIRQAEQSMSEDTAYEYVYDILALAAENGLYLPEEIADMNLPESDFETLSLTAWLSLNIKHAVLLSELCEDGGSYSDIDQWISDAQGLAFQYAREAILENWPECECGEPLEYYEEWLDNQCRGCYDGGHDGIAIRQRG